MQTKFSEIAAGRVPASGQTAGLLLTHLSHFNCETKRRV